MIDDSHLLACPVCSRRLERERELKELRADRPEVPCEEDEVAYGATWSPFGTVWVAASAQDIVAVSYAVDQRTGHAPAWAPSRLVGAIEQIEEYLSGRRRRFDLDLDPRGLTSLQRQVYAAVREIPFGTVRTYGQVARS